MGVDIVHTKNKKQNMKKLILIFLLIGLTPTLKAQKFKTDNVPKFRVNTINRLLEVGFHIDWNSGNQTLLTIDEGPADHTYQILVTTKRNKVIFDGYVFKDPGVITHSYWSGTKELDKLIYWVGNNSKEKINSYHLIWWWKSNKK